MRKELQQARTDAEQMMAQQAHDVKMYERQLAWLERGQEPDSAKDPEGFVPGSLILSVDATPEGQLAPAEFRAARLAALLTKTQEEAAAEVARTFEAQLLQERAMTERRILAARAMGEQAVTDTFNHDDPSVFATRLEERKRAL